MKKERKKFTTMSDMGNIKVFSAQMSAFFENGFGDGENIVEIWTDPKDRVPKDCEFLGHFTAKGDRCVDLSMYDCGDNPIYTFKKGRWFVYLKKPQHFIINKCDEEVHS